MKKIDCSKCKKQDACCSFGAWVDLEEAKKIIERGIKGRFYHLEKDEKSPSGYIVGTSYVDNRCSFLDVDGLCAVHKVDYDLKPSHCKEFPYERGKLSPFARYLCSAVKSQKRSKKKKGA